MLKNFNSQHKANMKALAISQRPFFQRVKGVVMLAKYGYPTPIFWVLLGNTQRVSKALVEGGK